MGLLFLNANMPRFNLDALRDDLRGIDESASHEDLLALPRFTAFRDHPLLWGLQEDPGRQLHQNYADKANLQNWHKTIGLASVGWGVATFCLRILRA
jgi:hypothetical protein